MESRLHGMVSIGLLGAAISLAVVSGFVTSWIWGVVYLVVSGVGLMGVVYAFCAKCPCQENCGHVFPGKLAALMERQPGPYTRVEMAVVAVALLALVGLPQAWLWRYPMLLMAFWVLAVISMMEIRAFVCRACDNVHCPVSVKS